LGGSDEQADQDGFHPCVPVEKVVFDVSAPPRF